MSGGESEMLLRDDDATDLVKDTETRGSEAKNNRKKLKPFLVQVQPD